jgi:hypothetical protein
MLYAIFTLIYDLSELYYYVIKQILRQLLKIFRRLLWFLLKLLFYLIKKLIRLSIYIFRHISNFIDDVISEERRGRD